MSTSDEDSWNPEKDAAFKADLEGRAVYDAFAGPTQDMGQEGPVPLSLVRHVKPELEEITFQSASMIDRDEWKYGPFADEPPLSFPVEAEYCCEAGARVYPGACPWHTPAAPGELPGPERASVLESRLRLHGPEFATRDRSMRFPWALFIAMGALLALAGLAIWYVIMRMPPL